MVKKRVSRIQSYDFILAELKFVLANLEGLYKASIEVINSEKEYQEPPVNRHGGMIT